MAKRWLFLCAVALVSVKAQDDLSDFSNNLATDIAPLLILFGESMTRQYLSESTSFLDYFIFAMAPIGILTAVVSVIRVCGHSSLRAFIGRSQEGDGNVEAELCTSTSRDVCELFNKGGITRVLGRPNILELIYVPRYGGQEVPDPSHGADKAGLFLFRHYLEAYGDTDASSWAKVRGSIIIGTGNERASFAPKPNLSLNVGIKKQPDWVFFVVAAVGFVLQAGVLALAGVGVWILHWNLNGAETSASRDYAPAMFITGTVLTCGGMWSCAALIGQTTHELRFRRKPQHPSQRPRLFWLQPGPQVIGDQTFDPFAYFEDTENDPLRVWTSSRKDFDQKFEVYTFFSVSAVLIGYVMQFIGLRGMNAWISLAQLGITVVMSILRGLLRVQRLGRNDNKLAEIPDMVSGHELDWLSFEIARQNCQQGPYSYWHITGQHKEAEEIVTRSSDSEDTSKSYEPSCDATKVVQSRGEVQLTPNTPPTVTFRADNTGHVGCDDLLGIRVRLAHLTGHISFRNIDDSEYQMWEDEYIKVRAKAGHVAAAICLAAANLFQKIRQEKDIILRIQAASLNEGRPSHQEQLVSVALKPPPEFSQASWRMDSAQLEAILGLWMWTLASDEHLRVGDESLQKVSRAEKVERARIVSAGPDDESWNDKANIQGEMNLWLGPRAVKFLEGTLTFDKQGTYSLATLWMKPVSGVGNNWKTLMPEEMKWNANQPKSVPLSQTLQRFCGWNPVHEALGSGVLNSTDSATAVKMSGRQADKQVKLRVQLAQLTTTDISLLDLCAQELFATLMMSLAALLIIDKTTMVESAGMVRLENTTVSIFANAFVESGLGSYSDALLCIIPALRKRLLFSNPDDMLSILLKAADDYRQKSEWGRAETVLRWACAHFSLSHDEELDLSHFFVAALRTIGELYRWSLAQHSDDARKKFGISGIEWMTKNYGSTDQGNSEVKKVLDHYREIAQRIAERPAGKNSAQEAQLYALSLRAPLALKT
ncbi:hypothetical protein DL768_006794 [Monosporascus sp. mg162]|nr:hypothetical protein DL768_006794 [Monosporascus sp. mg162]